MPAPPVPPASTYGHPYPNTPRLHHPHHNNIEEVKGSHYNPNRNYDHQRWRISEDTERSPPKTQLIEDDNGSPRPYYYPGDHDLTAVPTGGAGSSTRPLQRRKTSISLRSKRSRLGLRPEAPIADEHDTDGRQDLLWSRIRLTLREPLNEFWGTFILVLFGNGSVAQVLLSTGQTDAPGGNGFGGYQSISWGWGIGILLGLYVAGDSGAFLNPAVTFSNCFYRQLPWRRLPLYVLGQFLGGFAASGVVYLNYISAINKVEGQGIRTVPPNPTATGGIFCTYPQSFMTTGSAFFSECLASAILMFVIFALKDSSNNGIPKSDKWFPLCLFFLLFGIGACFGWETGYAINLARDTAPRLMSYIVGYGSEVWTAGNHYFWVPMVAPFVGCWFGGLLYDLFIYTGPSPINTPWLGLKMLIQPHRSAKEHLRREKDEDVV